MIDPELSEAADGLMRPAADSPAIDSAAGSYPDVTTDMDGQSRVAGPQDIGADELALTSRVFARLGADDVGPHWMRPSSLSILEIAHSSDEAEIVFEDETGLAPAYRLERSEDLAPGSWSTVATLVPVAHTSRVFRIIDPSANGSSAFWRVVRD